jgi:hypothetical protein
MSFVHEFRESLYAIQQLIANLQPESMTEKTNEVLALKVRIGTIYDIFTFFQTSSMFSILKKRPSGS